MTVPEDGSVYCEVFDWACPVSKNGRLVVMMPAGSKVLSLIESGILKVGVNSMDSTWKGGNAEPCSDDPLAVVGAVKTAICEPEYAFRPTEQYTHYLVTMRVLEVKGGIA
jgi:hypothetical protein